MDITAPLLYYMLTMESADILFLAHSHQARCQARVDKHFQGYGTLQYMDAGAVELFYGDQCWLMAGRWFWPADPGPHVRFHCAPGCEAWDHRHVACSGPRLEAWQRAGLWLIEPQPAPPGRDWAAAVDEIRTACERKDRWGPTRAANLLERLLLDLAEARSEPEDTEPWLAHVLRVLEQGELFPDYARLARECHMGLSTLRRRFKERMRISLHNYVLHFRIGTARSLLAGTDLPVKTVADRLGYNDVYYFSRQFRRMTGLTPTAFRESRQG